MAHPLRTFRTLLLLLSLLGGQVAIAQTPPPIPPTPVPAPPSPTPAPAPAPDPGPIVAPIIPVATITAPISVPAGAPLVAYGDQSVSSSGLSWILISPKGPYEVWDAPATTNRPASKGGLFIVRQPAQGVTYKLALVAMGTAPPFAFDFADIPVGVAPTPPPNPIPPGPIPPNPPAPVSLVAPYHFTLLVDSAAPLIDRLTLAPLADSPTIAGAVSTLGGTFHKLDVQSKSEYARSNLAPHLTVKDATGDPVAPPAIIIQDATGKVLSKVAVPAAKTEAAVLAYLKTLLGVN